MYFCHDNAEGTENENGHQNFCARCCVRDKYHSRPPKQEVAYLTTGTRERTDSAGQTKVGISTKVISWAILPRGFWQQIHVGCRKTQFEHSEFWFGKLTLAEVTNSHGQFQPVNNLFCLAFLTFPLTKTSFNSGKVWKKQVLNLWGLVIYPNNAKNITSSDFQHFQCCAGNHSWLISAIRVETFRKTIQFVLSTVVSWLLWLFESAFCTMVDQSNSQKRFKNFLKFWAKAVNTFFWFFLSMQNASQRVLWVFHWSVTIHTATKQQNLKFWAEMHSSVRAVRTASLSRKCSKLNLEFCCCHWSFQK